MDALADIQIRGARTHNLQNINLDLPRNRLIIITGLSGSGKSSLAFDTLYAEGQRRYVESLSAYARQFLSIMEKPDIDHISGLSPAVSIEQKTTSHNPRSTVGTITEIYDYLRLLYARTGEPHCPTHNLPLIGNTVSQMVDEILSLPDDNRLALLAPVVRDRKGEHQHLLQQLRLNGFVRVRIDGIWCDLDDVPELDKRRKHSIDVVVDRFKPRAANASRIAESLETTLQLSKGLATVTPLNSTGDEPLLQFSSQYACQKCGYSIEEMEPRLFSFNNPAGACKKCDGLGIGDRFDEQDIVIADYSLNGGAIRNWGRANSYNHQMLRSVAKKLNIAMDTPYKNFSKKIQNILMHGDPDLAYEFIFTSQNGRRHRWKRRFEGVLNIMTRRYKESDSERVRRDLGALMSRSTCEDCQGGRLNDQARNVLFNSLSLPELTAMPVDRLLQFFKNTTLSGWRKQIASKIISEIVSRLHFLGDVGLNYLNLARSAETLSGGEAQRIRLARQIGAGLVGVMYILDEPSIGLHQRDNHRLLSTLKNLRQMGNTVIVVEHDEEAICSADHIVDIGPGAGKNGGRIIAQGSLAQIKKTPESLTGAYLSGRKSIPTPERRRPVDSDRMLKLFGAAGNNLRDVDIELPLGLFVCVTGVSGSGKSSLINHTLLPILSNRLNRSTSSKPLQWSEIQGIELLDKCIAIDQAPIGRTPRSNPATYTNLFTYVRELFAATEESRARGYTPGRFSFNVSGGRCEACHGDGITRVEMHFLPDIHVPCDVCHGKRYNRQTLEIMYKGRNIHQILDMDVNTAMEFFSAVPPIARKLKTLIDVGLSYIHLGQSATTLSGGEAQRVKLSRELTRQGTGKTFYILDEPTTGLHFEDIRQLLKVLHQLCDKGNTVVVIEHNLDVIKTADWIVDLGPEGGSGGGKIIASGSPEQIIENPASHTGVALRRLFDSKKTG